MVGAGEQKANFFPTGRLNGTKESGLEIREIREIRGYNAAVFNAALLSISFRDRLYPENFSFFHYMAIFCGNTF